MEEKNGKKEYSPTGFWKSPSYIAKEMQIENKLKGDDGNVDVNIIIVAVTNNNVSIKTS